MSVFVQNCKKPKMEICAFCVITFEPIEIQNHEAPQNDRLNLSFVKDEHTNGEKMARNSRKTTIYESVSFRIRVYNAAMAIWLNIYRCQPYPRHGHLLSKSAQK